MDCNAPGSSVHGILQARILEWVAIPFSRGSSWTRDRTQVSSIAGRFFTVWATREANKFAQVYMLSSVQFSCSVVSYFCDPMNCSTPGFPVHHQLPELTQTHVHHISDAIQPSYPLPSPSPPAFNLSQNQGLFQLSQFLTSGGQSIGVSASALVLLMNIQD